MDETLPPFDESELSAEDLAVLQAFEVRGAWNEEQGDTLVEPVAASHPENAEDALADLLMFFATEVDEDISNMRRALSQLEQGDQIDPGRFVILQRIAHKIRGTAGAVECQGMAAVAGYMEVIAGQTIQGLIFPVIAVSALTQTIVVLEELLRNVTTNGAEGQIPLVELEDLFTGLNIDLQQPVATAKLTTVTAPLTAEDDTAARAVPRPLHDTFTPFIRVDARRVENLVEYSEQLAELRTPLESAQEQVDIALQELRAAQTRLRQMQPMLTTLLTNEQAARIIDEPSSSSLVARILNQAAQRNENGRRSSKSRSRLRASSLGSASSTPWDELDMQRFGEKELLVRSLSEAIMHVTIAAARLDATLTNLSMKQQEYISQVAMVRGAALLLRLVPLKVLVPRLQREVTKCALDQKQSIHFEVNGEETEVDQNILESLKTPLSHMIRTCISDTITEQNAANEPQRVWLSAQSVANEITLEIGFSMAVNGGALEAIREPMQRLNGAYSLQRNGSGGVSFYLRFPRSHGAAQCLLVRAGSQHLIVPFAQVQRVGESQREQLDSVYNLCELLGFPDEPTAQMRSVLILPQSSASRHSVGVTVDEVVSEVELVVKPLVPYLQRPGIAGAAADGKGRVLLMLDLPELVRHYAGLQRSTQVEPRQKVGQAKILIADDSAVLRRALVHMLMHANYAVMEASDGMQALEKVLESTPDLFLLDIEMPNLNGYDLLSLMSQYPELAHMKIVMLTSRSSEKHMQRARDLGAHAYLTKPCAQDALLETINTLLKH